MATSLDPALVVAGVMAVLAALAVGALALRGVPWARGGAALVVAGVALGLGAYLLAGGLGAFGERGVAPAPGARAPSSPAGHEVALPPCEPGLLRGCLARCAVDEDARACALAAAWFGEPGDGEPDHVRARALAERACALGSGLGCGHLGDLHARGLGGPSDLGRARALFAQACRQGEADRCHRALELGAGGEGEGVDALLAAGCATPAGRTGCKLGALELRDRGGAPLAARMLGWLCAEGDADACNERGLLESAGEGGASAQASAYFDAACEGGSRQGCINRAMGLLAVEPPELAEAGRLLGEVCRSDFAPRCFAYGASRSSALARQALYRAACDGGHAPACNDLGAELIATATGDDARAEALALMRRGCEGGERQGCSNLGFQILRGAAGAVPADAAWPWLERACVKAPGDVAPCAELGEAVHRLGHPELARRVAARGCDQHAEAEACAVLPFLTAGDEPDMEVILARSERGCELGSALACRNLGVLLRDGDAGAPRDTPGALAAFAKACDLGSATGCGELATLHGDDRFGVPADPARARDYARRACDLGAERHCEGTVGTPDGGR